MFMLGWTFFARKCVIMQQSQAKINFKISLIEIYNPKLN